MRELINNLFEVTDKAHYVKYNELVEMAHNQGLNINELCYELCQLEGVKMKWSNQRCNQGRIYGLKIKEETGMKLIFEGTQQQIKQEMEQRLNELNKQESLNNVSTKLSQHNLRLTQNEKDVLPVSVVKQLCQLEGHDWKVFKQELQTCGVKEKRTSNARLLTNLELIKED